MIRLVCTEDGSSKFWQAEVVGKTLKARWGRIGTEGQAKDKAFASPAAASAERDKLVREKRAKGYLPDGNAAANPAPAPAKAKTSAKPAAAESKAAAVLPAKTVKGSDAGPTPKNLKQACEVAAAGQIDLALPALEAAAAKGKASAWSALAQIRAYRGDWSGALDAAAKLLADPNDIYAGNVTDDAKWVVLRAAHETGRWTDAADAIKKAKRLGEQGKHALDAFIPKQAKAGGKLTAPVFAPPDAADAKLSDDKARALYDKWMKTFDEEEKKKKKKKPGDREDAQFAYGAAYRQDAIAMEAWPTVEPTKLWHDALIAARLFVRNGKNDEAWGIIERKIRHFWPVEGAQVAPIEPLADEVLRPIITPERLAILLATPKNAEL